MTDAFSVVRAGYDMIGPKYRDRGQDEQAFDPVSSHDVPVRVSAA